MNGPDGLRVAVDGRELEGRPTGVGRYLAGLLWAWATDGGSERFVVYSREPPRIDLPDGARFRYRTIGHPASADTWWQQWW